MSAATESQREAVLAQARRWIGTPYHHQADVVGAGVDCGMLLVRVFVDAGCVPAFDPRAGAGYSNEWFLHRDEERYLSFVQAYAEPVASPLPGDIVVFVHGRTFSHGGIVVAWPLIIHASAPAECVLLENVEQSPFAGKARRYYSVWGARA